MNRPLTSLRGHSTSWPPGTKFLDVEGVPVAYGPEGVFALDTPAPRPFPARSALRSGSVIPAQAFDKLRSRHWAQRICDNLNRGVLKNIQTS